MSDTVFDTRLDARSLIEASAGTGKTYALAGLFARAVIVGRLRVPQVLAVTYTVAATQELHERVRKRLQAAAQLAAQWGPDSCAEQTGDAPETAMLRRLIFDALHADDDTVANNRESIAALRMRLARAARDMDLAAITTIHGFCQRLLAEHALDAGQPLLVADIVPANAMQRNALAVALWRQCARETDGADFLQRRFATLDGLCGALRELLTPESLLPPRPAHDTRAERDVAWATLRQCMADTGDNACMQLRDATSDRVISSAKDKSIPVEALWAWFAGHGDLPPLQSHPHLPRLTDAWLRNICLKNKQAQLPQLALCGAVQTYLEAEEACDLQRLHDLRSAARARDAADKRAMRHRDYDDLIDAVHIATQDALIGPRLAAALRGQYPLVLVDEFQDTDARQWAIFERLFGEGGLLLVGDPKQAIYRFRGGDVETYLTARSSALLAAPLQHNYRARPCVLTAVNALFEQAPPDALGTDIAFASTLAGRAASCDAHLLIDNVPAPALTFCVVPPRPDTGKEHIKPESVHIAARWCADAIHDRLLQARAGRAQRVDADGTLRPLRPSDCAVLVRTHGEGLAMRDALARRGVPAVSAGRGSLFATTQAQTLLALLLALSAPGDDRRLRAALATPLFGLDAAGLSALDDDGAALAAWQGDFANSRLRWEQHGPQPMLADLIARQAPRLLALGDGERELTYLLQLAEWMQEARAQRLGIQGQLDWLRAAIANADHQDDTQQPRLESDAGRVQILTLHKSKGLEFPLVFLPFVMIGRGSRGKPDFVSYHDDSGVRVRQWKTAWPHAGALPWEDACVLAQAEEHAEDMRLLYVGLTRARDALWVCGGAMASNHNTALHRLLDGCVPNAALEQALDGLLQLQPGEDNPGLGASALDGPVGSRLSMETTTPAPDARTPQRRLRRDWWIHSFSQLHRQRTSTTQVPADAAPADDERPLGSVIPGLDSAPSRFGGPRFGNALHQALEHIDFLRWRGADGTRIPDGDNDILSQSLRDQDYPDDDIDDGVRELASLIARTLNAPLPIDAEVAGASHRAVRLCDVPASDRIAELEFHFVLADADSSALLALLHEHGIALARRDFGAWPRLAGLMNGKIDLICRIDGRVFVLDYKSNRLSDYSAATLAQTMATSEYDLQALLYSVAVHRWLRLRRGAGYDEARDMGGVRYLFCRGMDSDDAGRGIVAWRFDPALIEAVDALLAPNVLSESGDRA